MPRYRLSALGLLVLVLAGCAAQKPLPKSGSTANAAPAASSPAKPHDKAPRTTKSVPIQQPAKNEALTAHEVGYYLDVLQGRLQQQLDQGVIVGRERGSIVLDFSRRLGFAANSADLDAADRALLAPLAKILAEYRAALVSVRVSAEEDAVVARKLAQARANVLARALQETGIPAARIVAVVPSAAARDGEAHVEIVLAPETRGD